MKKIEYSPGLTAALTWASFLARREAKATMLPSHLLRGLLRETEGLAYRMLAEADADLTSLGPQTGDVSLVPGGSGQEGEDLPLSPIVGDVLAGAEEATRWLSTEGTITSDLVLLALLDRDPLSRETLIGLGLDWEAFRKRHPFEAPVLELDEPLQLEQGPTANEITRLLDAAANRAREALRVLEDYARFILDDAFLTRQLKELRHDLARHLAPWTLAFLQARDTEGDVGTLISTPGERERDSVAGVVVANAKRLQEALRSLEEYAKLNPAAADAASRTSLSAGLEQLRYQAYTLERTLVRWGSLQDRLSQALVYVLVSEKLCRASWLGTVREALDGGVDVVQLREKELDDRALLERAREIRKMTRDHDALFLVNDRPDIALLAEADGVHLGQDDLPVQAARRILGPGKLIGVSTHDLDQLRRAILDGASYVGIGPTFPSQTKGFPRLAGIEFIRQASRETSLPAFALGGITLDNLDQVLAAGGRRVAVSHAICAAEAPSEAVRVFKRRLCAVGTGQAGG